MIKLRDYQKQAVDRTAKAWEEHRAVLFVCPTGGGKTRVFTELARREAAAGGRTLILADRKTLVDQARRSVEELTNLKVGVEQARTSTDADADVVVATIQTIGKPDRLRRWKRDTFTLVVVDEADLGITSSYVGVVKRFPKARVFGCTATPDRSDKRSLGEVFDHVAHTVDMTDLIKQGHLSRLRRHLIRIESVSLEKLQSGSNGDFSAAALQRILTAEKPLHEVVRPTMDLAGDRPTLVFAVNVAHAEALAGLFNRYRPGSARAIDGEMNDAERKEITSAFERGEFQYLCNCALMLRGVDIPFISCVSMARPTKSRALYAQSIGRGTRVAPGKDDLLVLDFTDNSDRHDLVSVVDILMPGADPPAPKDPTKPRTKKTEAVDDDIVRERAKEICNAEPGCDPVEAIERARREVEADQGLRERVRAVVEFRLKEAARYPGAKGIDWDQQSLGQMSDADLGRMLGVSNTAVRQARTARGIPPFCVDWDQQPLGQVSDGVLAEELGMSKQAVRNAREARDIVPLNVARRERASASRGRADVVNWDKQPLGEIPDAMLARKLVVAIKAVVRAREVRGIAPFQPVGTDWDRQPLGQISDDELARRLGMSGSTVGRQRQKRNISACVTSRSSKGIDWDTQPLGQMPDTELATRLGVSVQAVLKQRKKRGIPAYLIR